MNNVFSVYSIHNKKQGLVYYGVSKNVKKRFESHRAARNKRESALYESFCEFGVASFDFVVLYVFNNHVDMLKKEVYLIAKARVKKAFTVLNRSDGGEWNNGIVRERDIAGIINSRLASFYSGIREVERLIEEHFLLVGIPFSKWVMSLLPGYLDGYNKVGREYSSESHKLKDTADQATCIFSLIMALEADLKINKSIEIERARSA